jgi:hypothetical protein
MRAARPPVLISLAIASAAFALSACGATDQAKNAVDPVAQAAEVTQNSGTAAVTFQGRVVVSGKTVPIDGQGVIDTRDGNHARMSFRLGGQRGELQEIFAGKTLYLGGSLVKRELPSGKSWAKMDLEKVAAKTGTTNLDGGGGSSASELLRYLRGAGSVRKEGTEKVAGASTTHYHAVADLAKLADERGDKNFGASMRRLRTQIDGPVTLDVWIDAAHRVRQERIDYAMRSKGKRAAFTLTMQLTQFGVPIKLDTPPKDDVKDVTDDVVRQVGRSG